MSCPCASCGERPTTHAEHTAAAPAWPAGWRPPLTYLAPDGTLIRLPARPPISTPLSQPQEDAHG